MRIHYLQHVPFEGVASMQCFFDRHATNVTATRMYESSNFPCIDSFDLLVIMGGPMNVNDEKVYPWLAAEKLFIKEAISKNKYILGICLGAQLIADVLGAAVSRNAHKEIGWHPMTIDPKINNSILAGLFKANTLAFHWHSDTFSLPDNSIPLGSSAACSNQGFIINDKIIGLQFHLETNPAWVESLASRFPEELTNEHYVQSVAQMLAKPERFEHSNKLMHQILVRIKDSINKTA